MLGGQAGVFGSKNVGSARAVTVTGLSLAGTDAGNYTVSGPAGLVADITPALLQITGLTAGNKVYDATTGASLTGTAGVAAFAGDAVSVAGTASASFADKNVGSAKPVAVSGLSLAGADAGNYVAQQPAGLVADITPAPLQITGLTAGSKVYDATTAPA